MKKIIDSFKNKAKEFALGPGFIKEEIIFEFLINLILAAVAGFILVLIAIALYFLLVKATLFFLIFLFIIGVFALGFFLFNKYGQYLLDKKKTDVEAN